MDRATLSTDVTALIKTFERPESLKRLIRSIRKYYPDLRIIVGDDSFEADSNVDAEYLRLPFDIGVSAGRNALLEKVSTPYFLLLDDDVEFVSATDLQKLLDIASHPEITLAAGKLTNHYRRRRLKGLIRYVRKGSFNWNGLFERHGDQLKLVPGAYHNQIGNYYICDYVHNFFIARTEHIRSMGAWDESLKLSEHTVFFLRLKQYGYKAAYCPEVRLRHWMDRPANYTRFRSRNYKGFAMRKHGINVFQDHDGAVYVFDFPETPNEGLLASSNFFSK